MKKYGIKYNYAPNINIWELGNKVPDQTPIIFGKPISSIITQGSVIEV